MNFFHPEKLCTDLSISRIGIRSVKEQAEKKDSKIEPKFIHRAPNLEIVPSMY
ncbi:hypothetical protein PGT21_019703 [Puccinia graminis f. sp. tritici]|uniref:Uncharacterized protein n=1 Tax=Puccinia graminis f. sp. tritici TaxID=56615 RepID=A0A5B0PY66_PUCGR|nr:hypothetical protein PGT21_019703 [Puccinia graminis f. sp. tritici]